MFARAIAGKSACTIGHTNKAAHEAFSLILAILKTKGPVALIKDFVSLGDLELAQIR
jgi:hypothetical protein